MRKFTLISLFVLVAVVTVAVAGCSSTVTGDALQQKMASDQGCRQIVLMFMGLPLSDADHMSLVSNNDNRQFSDCKQLTYEYAWDNHHAKIMTDVAFITDNYNQNEIVYLECDNKTIIDKL